jgi:hypothetical protein
MTLEKAKKIIKSECYIADLLNLDRTRMVNTALDAVIEAAEETRWIPVSERLPDKLNDVLITFYDCPNEYDVAYLRTTFNESYKKSGAKNEWVSSMGETTYADYEVDAWMPIQPYKAEGSESE